MKSLVDKLSAIAPELEQRDNVFLLALFERDDVPGKWDVVFRQIGQTEIRQQLLE